MKIQQLAKRRKLKLPSENLLRVSVERDGEIEELLAFFYSGEKFLHSVLQLVSHLINLFGITFSGVG